MAHTNKCLRLRVPRQSPSSIFLHEAVVYKAKLYPAAITWHKPKAPMATELACLGNSRHDGTLDNRFRPLLACGFAD